MMKGMSAVKIPIFILIEKASAITNGKKTMMVVATNIRPGKKIRERPNPASNKGWIFKIRHNK